MYFHSVATNAEVETMELQVLVAHGSNRAFALEEPLEVGHNVRPSVPVAIQWNRPPIFQNVQKVSFSHVLKS